MKIALFIGFTLIIIPQWVSSTDGNTTDLVAQAPRKEILLDTIVRRLKTYWFQNDDSNTFVGK